MSRAAFLSQQGIDTKKVGLQAFGDTVQRQSKERSRRVEIVVSTRE